MSKIKSLTAGIKAGTEVAGALDELFVSTNKALLSGGELLSTVKDALSKLCEALGVAKDWTISKNVGYSSADIAKSIPLLLACPDFVNADLNTWNGVTADGYLDMYFKNTVSEELYDAVITLNRNLNTRRALFWSSLASLSGAKFTSQDVEVMKTLNEWNPQDFFSQILLSKGLGFTALTRGVATLTGGAALTWMGGGSALISTVPTLFTARAVEKKLSVNPDFDIVAALVPSPAMSTWTNIPQSYFSKGSLKTFISKLAALESFIDGKSAGLGFEAMILKLWGADFDKVVWSTLLGIPVSTLETSIPANVWALCSNVVTASPGASEPSKITAPLNQELNKDNPIEIPSTVVVDPNGSKISITPQLPTDIVIGPGGTDPKSRPTIHPLSGDDGTIENTILSCIEDGLAEIASFVEKGVGPETTSRQLAAWKLIGNSFDFASLVPPFLQSLKLMTTKFEGVTAYDIVSHFFGLLSYKMATTAKGALGINHTLTVGTSVEETDEVHELVGIGLAGLTKVANTGSPLLDSFIKSTAAEMAYSLLKGRTLGIRRVARTGASVRNLLNRFKGG